MNGQHTKFGNGLIGGDRNNPKVVVAANGGSDLIYLPDGDKAIGRSAWSIPCWRRTMSAAFSSTPKLGKFPGTLTLDDIALEGSAITPHPAIAVSFRSFDTVCGEPVRCTVEVADTILQQGQGMHGSFSRADTWNFMAHAGAGFQIAFPRSGPGQQCRYRAHHRALAAARVDRQWQARWPRADRGAARRRGPRAESSVL